jgi:FAD/FMN-containing dehydrogenase
VSIDERPAPGPTTVTTDAVAALRAALLGTVLVPGDAGYDNARRVWNGLIDRHPAVIVRCSGMADVVEAVAFARHHPVPVSIRGGGHQVAGSAVCDDGIVIDLSTMNGVLVDPVARTARVQAGARWADVDRATQLFGLATTGGEVSITGVAGLTLGGGMGLTQRAFGLACDNLRSIEIVTADGVVRTASPDQHPDLFWAAKGGGRGLGVVTAFEFALHPLGPDVTAAMVAYADDEATAVVRAWHDLALDAPDVISPELNLWTVPPDPALPAELHGRPIVLVAALFAGDPADADATLRPYRELAEPLLDMTETMPYAVLQSAFDAVVPDGNRYYFKSHFTDELTDDAIDALIAVGRARPNPDSLVVVRTMGGAISRVSADDSAYPHRGARFNISLDGLWSDPADDAAVVGWSRQSWDRLRPFANGGVYVNFAGFEGEADVSPAATFGSNVERLDAVRADYDPDGLFTGAAARP